MQYFCENYRGYNGNGSECFYRGGSGKCCNSVQMRETTFCEWKGYPIVSIMMEQNERPTLQMLREVPSRGICQKIWSGCFPGNALPEMLG